MAFSSSDLLLGEFRDGMIESGDDGRTEALRLGEAAGWIEPGGRLNAGEKPLAALAGL